VFGDIGGGMINFLKTPLYKCLGWEADWKWLPIFFDKYLVINAMSAAMFNICMAIKCVWNVKSPPIYKKRIFDDDGEEIIKPEVVQQVRSWYKVYQIIFSEGIITWPTLNTRQDGQLKPKSDQ
jgi:hypothetical protein